MPPMSHTLACGWNLWLTFSQQNMANVLNCHSCDDVTLYEVVLADWTIGDSCQPWRSELTCCERACVRATKKGFFRKWDWPPATASKMAGTSSYKPQGAEPCQWTWEVRRAAGRNIAQSTPWLQPQQSTNQAVPRLLTHGKIINVCCFRLLNLWQFVTQQ